MQRLVENESFFRQLTKFRAKDRKKLLKKCSLENLKALCELVENSQSIAEIRKDRRVVKAKPIFIWFRSKKILCERAVRALFIKHNVKLAGLVSYVYTCLLEEALECVLLNE